MEKSLPHISLHGKESQQKQTQPPPAATPPPRQGRYDTHLLPHISLPQRQQQVVGGQRVGLLRYTTSAAQNDPGLTAGMDKYELARKIAAMKQAQATRPPMPQAGPVSHATPVPSATFKQQYMQAQQASAQKLAPQSRPTHVVISPAGKQYIGSEKIRDIAHARTLVIIKAVVTFGLFAGVACVIWTLFSHNIIYILAMFIVLAVMLGSILSTSMGDYYRLGLNKLKTTLQLRVVDSPKVSNALQGVRAPHLRMKNDTSGYLSALKKTFPKEREGGPRA
ncbi:MAG TPA: hypothetical protein VL485_33165 [Ktedonobacteraceae bacterium]|jgi:hypothetical protein|nr:hypothetical protein [Ktedonobacteraceae bacterium]